MVSAWANAHRLVLGQLKVDDKSNEITAIPALLRMLEIEGAIVTIDAMGCQKEIAKTITEQGADYVLALKDNHPTLHGEVELLFEDIKAERLDGITAARHTTVDADHGRLETRHYWITSDIECLGVKGSWANITSVGLVESQRDVGGAVSIEQRCSSMDDTPYRHSNRRRHRSGNICTSPTINPKRGWASKSNEEIWSVSIPVCTRPRDSRASRQQSNERAVR